MKHIVCWVMACFWMVSVLTEHSAIAHPLSPAGLTYSPESIFTQGVEAVEAGDFDLALRAFTAAIAVADHPTAAYANRCLVEIQLDHYPQAIADCTEAIDRQPENWEAVLNRGLAQYRMGNFAAAIDDNSRVLQAQPQDARAYNNRGLAEAALNQHEAAIADFNRALRYTPSAAQLDLAEIYLNLGTSWMAVQRLTEAMLQFAAAIDLNPADDRAYFNRGCLYMQQQAFQLAMQDFDQALQLNPDSTSAEINRAIVLYELGHLSDALTSLRILADRLHQHNQLSEMAHVQRLIDAMQRSPTTVVG